MRKQVFGLSAAIMLIIVLAACSSQETAGKTASSDLVFPEIPQNYWGLFDNNCFMIYEQGFVSTNSINLTLLSASPLEQSDVDVSTSTGGDMIYYLDPYDGDTGKCVIYEDIFLLYQGVSADELLKYTAGSLSAERKAEIDGMRSAFRKLDESKKPVLYRYVLALCVPIETVDGDAVLDALSVTVKGETRTYQLGTLCGKTSEAGEYAGDPNFSLNCDDNVAYFGFSTDISSDGSIMLDNIKYTAANDVRITGIRFYGTEDVKIQSVSVVQSAADGAVIDTEWDTVQPIELEAGDHVCLNVRIADPFFAGSLGGWDVRYLMLEYQCSGETYELGIPFYFAQSLPDAFAYIANEEGIDVLSYYISYINAVGK